MKDTDNKLNFDEFEKATYDDWKESAVQSLKGQDFDKSLFRTIPENIRLQPIYFPGIENIVDSIPGEFPYIRGNSNHADKSWLLLQKTVAESPIEMNKILHDELEKGQNSIYINLSNNYSPISGKNNIRNFQELSEYLNGIDITKYHIFIETGLNASEAFALFEFYLKSNNISNENITGNLLFDPITEIAKNGNSEYSLESYLDEYSDLSIYINYNFPNFSSNFVDASSYSIAGSNVTEELAIAMSLGIEYLRKLSDSDNEIQASNKFTFKFSVSTNFFLEIAKYRAARKLWAGICNKSGFGNEKSFIICETSFSNKSSLDIYVNMLRNTTEIMSAVSGGADTIISTPFDFSVDSASEFSRRNARNTQLVLQYESHLTDTIDPAGGSYYIENLTNELIEKAWEIIQKIEQNGGIIKSLLNSYIQNELIKKSVDKTKEAIRTRRKTILGTNLYPNISEKILKVQPFESMSEPITFESETIDSLAMLENLEYPQKIKKAKELVQNIKNISNLSSIFNRTKDNIELEKLSIFRESSQFEELRYLADEFTSRNGNRPEVFLLNLGTIKNYKSRNDFSGDFFRTGGIDCIDSNPVETIEQAINEVRNSDQIYIVICSSDDIYEKIVPELSNLIKTYDKSKKLILAGNPKMMSENIKNSSIDSYIFIGSDVYSTLTAVLKDIINPD